MKSKNIFLGTIKKCKSLYWYEQYGDERYVGDFETRCIKSGTIHRFVDIIDKRAILIKVNEQKYIWIDFLNTLTDEFLVNLGIPIKTISTIPTSDNQLFVDEETLEPYFKNNVNKNLSVKSLKKLNH